MTFRALVSTGHCGHSAPLHDHHGHGGGGGETQGCDDEKGIYNNRRTHNIAAAATALYEETRSDRRERERERETE